MSRRIVRPLAVASTALVAGSFLLGFRRRKGFLSCTDRDGSRFYMIRHGESTVNARGAEYRERGDENPGRAYHEVEFFDAELTDVGRKQASTQVLAKMKECVGRQSQERRVRLVVTSPLRRALETSALGVLPILPPDQHTTWVALDSVREAMTLEIHSVDDADSVVHSQAKPCNSRGSLDCSVEAFPHVDFAHCDKEDPLDPLETIQELDRRIDEFVTWLRVWEQKVRREHGDVQIDVVLIAHYVFLRRVLSRLQSLSDSRSCGMQNCEIRELPLSKVLQCKLQ